MNTACRTIGAMAAIAVLLHRTAWGSAEPQTTKAPGAVVKTEAAASQPSSNLTFTPIVRRALPVRPDYRGAITTSFNETFQSHSTWATSTQTTHSAVRVSKKSPRLWLVARR
jgi:hypothetical protein